MVAHHPEVFEGVEMAITEGLGSSEINGRTVFLVNTGEKGIIWLRLNATGTAGHGSRVHEDNAIITLANAISRLGDSDWPVTLTPTTDSLVRRLRKITGAAQDADALEVARMASSTNALAGIFRNVANVTMFSSGYKSNVIPGHASAVIDVRDLPGQREQVLARLREILGSSIDIEVLSDVAPMESNPDSPLFAAITRSVLKYAPDAEVVPSIATGGSDNAFLTPLGIQGYGFAPLLLPADFNFAAMFHGVDERVPLDSLVFGQKVLTELLETY
jgi:acetylornithine deacetylase/succinyl-diaminopimelate desuccinylase-like protein